MNGKPGPQGTPLGERVKRQESRIKTLGLGTLGFADFEDCWTAGRKAFSTSGTLGTIGLPGGRLSQLPDFSDFADFWTFGL